MLTKGLQTEFTKTLTNRTLILFVMMPLLIAVVLLYLISTETQIFGMLAFFNVFMISIMDTLVSLVEEREHKTIEAMMITPLGLNTVLLSKVIVSALLVFGNAVLITVVIPWVFNISFSAATVVFIVLLSVALSFLYSGLAITLAAFMNTMKEAEQTGTAAATILLVVGFIPLERLPHVLQEIIKIVPFTSGNYLFTSILLDSPGKGLATIGPNLVITLAFCAVMIYLGIKMFRRSIYT